MSTTDDDREPADTDPNPNASAQPKRRLVALTAAGEPIPRAFALCVQALRDRGAEVVPLPVPTRPPEAASESAPSLAELKRGIGNLAREVMTTLRGPSTPEAASHWVASHFDAVEGHVDAVIALDAGVARAAFPAVAEVWPRALRVGVDPDFDVDPTWHGVEVDDLIVPHHALAQGVPRIAEGLARARAGGPVAEGRDAAARTLSDLPLVIVSFARLDPGDVDPLLFQLSLARPERFDLMFLPSGRVGVDELVRTRAANYGLRGKRPRARADVQPWIRGAAVLAGHPSPIEAAGAVHAGVPQLLFAPERRLSAGDRFFIKHGVAAHTDVPLTLAVHVEGLLPGGADRARFDDALGAIETSGARGVAGEILDAITEGRPEPRPVSVAEGAEAWQDPGAADGDDLEDIGAPAATTSTAVAPMSMRLRRAYLSEIILQHQHVGKQLTRARSGLTTWQRRVRLARSSGDEALVAKAAARVEGLERVIARLTAQLGEIDQLRDRFASRDPLTEADRARASRFMSPETAATLDRGEAPESAFTRLELDDALRMLKDRIRDDEP